MQKAPTDAAPRLNAGGIAEGAPPRRSQRPSNNTSSRGAPSVLRLGCSQREATLYSASITISDSEATSAVVELRSIGRATNVQNEQWASDQRALAYMAMASFLHFMDGAVP